LKRWSEEPFSQLLLVNRIVDTGIAMYEGWLNRLADQIPGHSAALMLTTLSIGSAILVRRREHRVSVLGPPLPIGKPRWSFTLVAAIGARRLICRWQFFLP